MKLTLLVLVAGLLVTAHPTLGSGSSGPTGIPTGNNADPFTVTETMKCRITAIRPNGTILVQDKATRSTVALELSTETKIMAADPSSFGGRKRLSSHDLEAGQRLTVITREQDGRVLKIKVHDS